MKNVLKLSSLVADYNNPRMEINYTFYDGKNLVSTDTKRLLIIDMETFGSEMVLLETGKVAKKKENADGICFGIPCISESKIGKYPSYERIIPKELEKFECIEIPLDATINETLFYIYKYQCFDYKFIECLFKCEARIEFAYFNKEYTVSPFVLTGKIDGYNFKYIVMPIKL